MQTTVEARKLPQVRQPKERDYLSFSAISLFQQCSLKYAFKYVAGLPEMTIGSSLAFGSAMHAAVQLHFERLLAGNEPPDLDSLLSAFWDSWNGHEGQTILFGKNEDVSTVGKQVDRMLRVFLASDFARPKGTIIGVEEELRCKLIQGCPDLLARVDLIVETDEAILVTDFKTAARTWSQDHVIDAGPQLILYSEVAQKLAGGKPVRIGFAVLTKTQSPELVIHPVTLDDHQVQRTKKVVERVWRAIQGATYYPSPSAMDCPGCPFRQTCRDWAG